MILGIAAAALFAFGVAETTRRPIERRLTVVFAQWPADAPPLRVALLSDIHMGNHAMDAARLRAIVDQVDAARPDLVLLAGDFVNGNEPPGEPEHAAELTASLAALHAPLGVVAVLGNHDYWTIPQAVRAALRKAGVTVLENDAVRRGPIAVLGVADSYSGHPDVPLTLARAARLGGVPIVLTHAPDLALRLPPGLPLMLAGHTHCGQVVLPLLGAPVEHWPLDRFHSVYSPRYRCGVIHDPERLVVVTAGLGSGASAVRIGAPPDFWMITLRGRSNPSRIAPGAAR